MTKAKFYCCQNPNCDSKQMLREIERLEGDILQSSVYLDLLEKHTQLEEQFRDVRREMELRSSRETRTHIYEENALFKKIAELEAENAQLVRRNAELEKLCRASGENAALLGCDNSSMKERIAELEESCRIVEDQNTVAGALCIERFNKIADLEREVERLREGLTSALQYLQGRPNSDGLKRITELAESTLKATGPGREG